MTVETPVIADRYRTKTVDVTDENGNTVQIIDCVIMPNDIRDADAFAAWVDGWIEKTKGGATP